jgi:hypothetical protein
MRNGTNGIKQRSGTNGFDGGMRVLGRMIYDDMMICIYIYTIW